MKDQTERKIFFILLSLSLISIALVFPYILSVQEELLKGIGQPIWIIFAAQCIQSLILFSAAIHFGLFFARKTGFQLPLIRAAVEKKDYGKILEDILGISVFAGIASAAAIYASDYLFAVKGVAISTHESYAPVWQKLLASFYGGITEEVLMRLFLMTFFVWIGMRLLGRKQPAKAGIILSILLAAVIFGLGHLPITASMTALTPLIIARAIVLNGIGGIVFGWLFWKKGLESAMIAHFTADIFLLTLFPLIFG